MMPPQTSIADVVALARGAAVMVSGDTGPTHLAAAVGTPIVGIYGPTRPERNGPWQREDETVSRAADLSAVITSDSAGSRGCACWTSRWRRCSLRSSGAWTSRIAAVRDRRPAAGCDRGL